MSASFLRCPERVVWSDLPARNRNLRLDILAILSCNNVDDDPMLAELAVQDSEFGKQRAQAEQLPPRLLPHAPHSAYLHAYFLICLAPLVPSDEDARALEDLFVTATACFFTMDDFCAPYTLACAE